MLNYQISKNEKDIIILNNIIKRIDSKLSEQNTNKPLRAIPWGSDALSFYKNLCLMFVLYIYTASDNYMF